MMEEKEEDVLVEAPSVLSLSSLFLFEEDAAMAMTVLNSMRSRSKKKTSRGVRVARISSRFFVAIPPPITLRFDEAFGVGRTG